MTAHFREETWAQFMRWMWQLKRQPSTLVMTLTQPLMWLLLFGPVMARRAAGMAQETDAAQGSDYMAFMVPGVMAFTIFGSSMMAGIPILFDKETGFLTRLLASPASRASILAGRALYTTVFSIVQAGLILGLGMIQSPDLRFADMGVLGVLGMLAVAVLFSFALTAFSLALAFRLPHHSLFFVIIGTFSLPVMFLSSALFPVDKMPGWMAWCAKANPMTYAIDGLRAASQGDLSGLPMILIALVIFNALTFYWSTKVCSKALA